ncbi:MAG TPA: ATP-binding protein, partial [Deferrisomatales bacterium]|nr:ATP-binding protein [Deferrisomatales bacterium]
MKRLHDLLGSFCCAESRPEEIFPPALEGLRQALGAEAVRLTLYSAEGHEVQSYCTGGDCRWPHPGDSRVPCRHGDRTLGMLEIRGEGDLGEDRRWLLELAADRIAVETHNQMLAEAVRAATLESQAIDAVSREMNGGSEIERLTELVLRQAVDISGAAGGALYLKDAKDGALRLQTCHPASKEWARERIPFGHELVGWVAKNALPRRAPDEGAEGPGGPEDDRKNHLAVPLINAGEVGGVLSLVSVGRQPFTATHERILTVFAAQASKALAAAQLIRVLREERDLRENILAGTPNGVIAVDQGRRVVLMNNAARHLFAAGEAAGTQQGNPIERYLPQQAFLQRLQRVLSGAAEVETLELSHGSAARRRDYLINIFRLHRGDSWAATLIVKEVTEQRQLDDEVLRMGRVASLGQLAAGIAHEIRNPLTGVSITLDILREEEGLSAEALEMIDDIGREIDRLEALVHGLLDFARPQPTRHRPMRLAKALDWHRTFREQCRNKGLEFRLELEDNPKIQGDPERLKQLFLNLAINALDATEPGGKVTVRAGIATHPGRPARAKVELTDTGRGMDESTRQQVFDPFFTTKNDGTGLGLSIAHSIAEQHGGRIEVDSTPGGGTTFRVELPTY